MDEESRTLLQLLLARLERISADSQLAHQASGVRGSLLKILDTPEAAAPPEESLVTRLMDDGFSILRDAFLEKAR